MTRLHSKPIRRCTNDDGAVIVEFAIIAPILVMFFAGIVDIGVGYRDRTEEQGTLQSAARTDSNADQNYLAEYLTVVSYEAGVNKFTRITPVRLISYLVTPSGSPSFAVPASCLSAAVPANASSSAFGGVVGLCNVYGPLQMSFAGSFVESGASTSPFTCNPSAGWDRDWCPGNRHEHLTDNGNDGPDFVGLYVELTYSPLVGMWTHSVTFKDTAVSRIEPQ